jgi:hypothetical protein
MGTAVIVILVVLVVAVYASRVGLPGRPRRRDVAGEQRRFLEQLLPAAEEEARRRGMSEDEIEAKERRLRDELPIAPDGETLEPDGTVVDRREHVL